MDRGAWQDAAHKVTRVGHDLATKSPPPPSKLISLKNKTATCHDTYIKPFLLISRVTFTFKSKTFFHIFMIFFPSVFLNKQPNLCDFISCPLVAINIKIQLTYKLVKIKSNCHRMAMCGMCGKNHHSIVKQLASN